MRQVRVNRERPSVAAWAVALTVTMLAVYVLTLSASAPDAVESVSAAPRVTRQIELAALKAHCVTLGGWKDENAARLEAAGFAARGAAGFLYAMDGEWHVLGALYDSDRDAARAVDRLKAEGVTGASVIPLSADAVRLRVTAPDQQIDAIAALDACIRDEIAQLRHIAAQLDRNEIKPDAARTLCAVAATKLGDVSRALAAIPGASENRLCGALIDAATELQSQLSTISGDKGSAGPAMTGMVRLAGLDAFLNLWAIQNGLTSG